MIKGAAVSLIAMSTGGCGTLSVASPPGRALVALKEVFDGFSHLIEAMFYREKTEVAASNNIILSGALTATQNTKGNMGAIIVDRRDADKLYDPNNNQFSIVPVYRGQGFIEVAKNNWNYFSIMNPGLKPGDYAVTLYTEKDKLS